MSVGAFTAGVAMPEDELAVAQRVQQLQALIERARQVSDGSATSATPGSATVASQSGSQAPAGGFAAALRSATAEVASPVAALGGPVAGAQGGGGEYDSMIEQAASRYGLDPALLHGLIQQESGFDPNAQSSVGASGLTQLMPATASSLGVANPLNAAESIEGGARYLSQLMTQFGGNATDALAAYNAGPGAVQRYGGVPPYPETEAYVSKVLGYAESYRRSHAALGAPGTVA